MRLRGPGRGWYNGPAKEWCDRISESGKGVYQREGITWGGGLEYLGRGWHLFMDDHCLDVGAGDNVMSVTIRDMVAMGGEHGGRHGRGSCLGYRAVRRNSILHGNRPPIICGEPSDDLNVVGVRRCVRSNGDRSRRNQIRR